jgi:hypothetical protein
MKEIAEEEEKHEDTQFKKTNLNQDEEDSYDEEE